MKTALLIVQDDTREIVRVFDTTDMSERKSDKLFNGLCQRVDFDRFSIEEWSGKKLPKEGGKYDA